MGTPVRQPALRVYLRGAVKMLSVVEAPRVANNRLLLALIVEGVAILALAFGIARMLPLKERVPYVVDNEIDSSGKPTGRVTVREGGVKTFAVQEAHIRYFVRQWVEDYLTIDEYTKDLRLPRSYALLRGQALQDWQYYLTNMHKPLERLAENPQFRLRAEPLSINFLDVDKTNLLIRVKLTSDNGSERRLVINMKTVIIPPKDDEEVNRNPVGLWITQFGESNETL